MPGGTADGYGPRQGKSEGFTVNPNPQDENMTGIVAYAYHAKNADGCAVKAAFSAGVTGMAIIAVSGMAAQAAFAGRRYAAYSNVSALARLA
jgi:hypothetical protein